MNDQDTHRILIESEIGGLILQHLTETRNFDLSLDECTFSCSIHADPWGATALSVGMKVACRCLTSEQSNSCRYAFYCKYQYGYLEISSIVWYGNEGWTNVFGLTEEQRAVIMNLLPNHVRDSLNAERQHYQNLNQVHDDFSERGGE